MDEPDETDSADAGGLPLPRRAPGGSRIVQARERLYGAEDTDPTSDPHRWGDLDRRERSAALARVAVDRRRTEERPARIEPNEGPASGSDTAGETTTPHVVGRPDGPAPDAPGAEPEDRRAASVAIDDRHQAVGRKPRWARLAAAAAAVLLLVFAGGVVLGGQVATPPTPAPIAGPPPLPSRPTLVGDVVRVHDGQTLTVLVGGRTVEVSIAGLDAPRAAGPGLPAACGADRATTFAADALTGQRVTLVPDLVGPEFDLAGRRFAYVVLQTQLNYTDLALLEGIARRDTTHALSYGPVFAREEASARAASAGIWGDPCRAAS